MVCVESVQGVVSMTDYRQLCAKVLAYYEGQNEYDFSHLGAIAKDNAAFDAWQELREELKTALAKTEPEGPTDEELGACADEFLDWNPEGIRAFARAVLARWGSNNTSRSNFDD